MTHQPEFIQGKSNRTTTRRAEARIPGYTFEDTRYGKCFKKEGQRTEGLKWGLWLEGLNGRLRGHLCQENSDEKPLLLPGVTAEVRAQCVPSKHLRDRGGGSLHISLSCSSLACVADDEWKLTAENLSQAVTPAAAVADMGSSLERISTSPGSWCGH